ncbi:MAG: hypothetical protein K8R36_06340, partial [Planctomycetales bacterium]|nr:hypothetical protein [Planctomycetales bacterium]
MGISLLPRCANRPGGYWLRLFALATLGPLAGCAGMNLMNGKLPIGEDEDLGIVTHPYPGWENKAKETLDKIPSAGEKQQTTPAAAASPTGTPSASSSVPGATNVNTNVTTEQPQAANPATVTAAQPLPAAPVVFAAT